MKAATYNFQYFFFLRYACISDSRFWISTLGSDRNSVVFLLIFYYFFLTRDVTFKQQRQNSNC